MKTLRLILFGTVVGQLLLLSTAHAQYNIRRSPRGMAARATGQAQTNTAAKPAPAPPAAAQAVPAQPAPAAPVVRTQAMVRIVQPPVDPEKARIAKEESLRKTVEFQKKRAEEGSESAQYELGVRYLKGDGVEKDEATARRWLALSAKNGYLAASKKLEDLDRPPEAPKEAPVKEQPVKEAPVKEQPAAPQPK